MILLAVGSLPNICLGDCLEDESNVSNVIDVFCLLLWRIDVRNISEIA